MGPVNHLPSGDMIETAWRDDEREEDWRAAIKVETSIYQRLGEHPRLVKMKYWDIEANIIIMEYMKNGNLYDYVKSHFGNIPLAQKISWSLEIADAVELLHSSGVIHCDIGPDNLLLDDNMSIKIIDFSGSSIDGSPALVCPSVRYRIPDADWKTGKAATLEEDFFSLGSTLYFIMTGKAPYEELSDYMVEKKFLDGEFPDLRDIPCSEAIASTWQQRASSAGSIRAAIEEYKAKTIAAM